MISIDRLQVEAYRSLYNVTIEPRPLTVVVGPNNSGKSNLVDAIEFLGEVHRHGLEIAIQRKGGFENIAHRRMRRSRRPIAFRIRAVVPLEPDSRAFHTWRSSAGLRYVGARRSGLMVRVEHEFELRAQSQAIRADYRVSTESISFFLLAGEAGRLQQSLFGAEQKPFLRLNRKGDDVTRTVARPADTKDLEWDLLAGPLGDETFAARLERFAAPTELMLTRLPFVPAYETMSHALAETRVYQLAPLECRRAGVPTPNADLDRHGANLPALVDFMMKHHPDEWARVKVGVQRILPDLDDIRVANTPDRRLALSFVEAGVGRPWTSDEVSDGTIQSLALFAALYDPRFASIVIEEPENSVHPWILRVFIDACRDVTGKTVMLTTHSPVVIDYVEPSELLLMWRKDGRSHLAGLEDVDPEARDLWEAGKIGLFEILDGGWIRESVPVVGE